MNNKIKLLFFLLVIPGLLPEVLSGNTPIIKFTSLLDTFFLVLAYGIPMLLIRELKIRYNISYLGIFILGLAYGIFNEGFIAKTILDTSLIPTGGFQGFGLYGGLNMSWSLMIIPWHAFFSIIFPMVFAEHIFPEQRTVLFLSKKLFIFFTFLLYGGLVFLAKDWQGSISGILVTALYIVSFILILISFQFQDIVQKDASFKKRPHLMGLLTIVIFLLFFLGASNINFYIYLILGCIMWIILVRYFLVLSSVEKVYFGLGSYLSFGGFATLASIGVGRLDLIIVYPCILFILYYYCILKKKSV